MTSVTEIEFLALVEKLEPTDLSKAAALLFKAWCDDRGTSIDSALEFFVSVIELQTDESQEKLETIKNTLHQFSR